MALAKIASICLLFQDGYDEIRRWPTHTTNNKLKPYTSAYYSLNSPTPLYLYHEFQSINLLQFFTHGVAGGGAGGGWGGVWISLDKPWISKDDHFQKER